MYRKDAVDANRIRALDVVNCQDKCISGLATPTVAALD